MERHCPPKKGFIRPADTIPIWRKQSRWSLPIIIPSSALWWQRVLIQKMFREGLLPKQAISPSRPGNKGLGKLVGPGHLPAKPTLSRLTAALTDCLERQVTWQSKQNSHCPLHMVIHILIRASLLETQAKSNWLEVWGSYSPASYVAISSGQHSGLHLTPPGTLT